ncbi:MAG: CBS domain-containing protein [Halobellus sp.]|uniref:CBS domain-containing protein n=1 Tax=Halobellus sp. TaxID=1979212 RepID=UPI0035D4C87C
MTGNFETIPRDQTLDLAVELMLSNKVDHILVIEDGTPAAMLTRRKALIACYKTDASLSDIPISGFSRGLETKVGPNETALIAVGKLRRAKVNCLPVVNGMSIEGVVTKDDIIENLSNITSDMIEEDERKDEWTA